MTNIVTPMDTPEKRPPCLPFSPHSITSLLYLLHSCFSPPREGGWGQLDSLELDLACETSKTYSRFYRILNLLYHHLNLKFHTPITHPHTQSYTRKHHSHTALKHATFISCYYSCCSESLLSLLQQYCYLLMHGSRSQVIIFQGLEGGRRR